MTAILIALVAFALSGFGFQQWLRRNSTVRQASAPQARSADQLAKLHWREFTKLVLQAMHGRGYNPVIEDGMPADGIPTDGSDILLARNGEYALLSCKYGTSSLVSAAALLGLSKSATLRGAERTVVVTPGHFDDEAVRVAQLQDIELIDGETLWPEVRPYVAHPEEIAPPKGQPSKAHSPLLAWIGAALIGGLAWMLSMSLLPHDSPQADDDMPPMAAAVHTNKAQATAQAKQIMEVVPTDPAELEKRRREASNTISTLFGVSRALWSTQSTLLVYLSSDEADPINELCPLLERYPELASSRVQLQPPPGSSKAVRFKQCRTF